MNYITKVFLFILDRYPGSKSTRRRSFYRNRKYSENKANKSKNQGTDGNNKPAKKRRTDSTGSQSASTKKQSQLRRSSSRGSMKKRTVSQSKSNSSKNNFESRSNNFDAFNNSNSTSNKSYIDRKGFEAHLKTLDINFQAIDHKEVFTVDTMMECLTNFPGLTMKNLFLKDKKKNLYLLAARHDAKVSFL